MSAGGSVEANIARWVGQFRTAAGKPLGPEDKKDDDKKGNDKKNEDKKMKTKKTRTKKSRRKSLAT